MFNQFFCYLEQISNLTHYSNVYWLYIIKLPTIYYIIYADEGQITLFPHINYLYNPCICIQYLYLYTEHRFYTKKKTIPLYFSPFIILLLTRLFIVSADRCQLPQQPLVADLDCDNSVFRTARTRRFHSSYTSLEVSN